MNIHIMFFSKDIKTTLYYKFICDSESIQRLANISISGLTRQI